MGGAMAPSILFDFGILKTEDTCDKSLRGIAENGED